MLEKIKRAGRQVLGLFPSALPNGVSAFNDWAESIVNTYDLPTKDLDSVKFTLATIIMHLGSNVAYKSKYHFVLILKASAAKQIAHAAFSDIKQKQAAAEEAKAKLTTNESGR